MDDPGKEITESRRTGRYLVRAVISVAILTALIVLAAAIYLATPFPARQVSLLASSYLHQNLTIASLRTDGRSLYLGKVRLENPAGFPSGSLASADSVTIAPIWSDLLQGRQRYRLVAVDGMRIELQKNNKGAWNFEPLRQLLASRKPAPGETSIGQLSVKNGSVMVSGEGVEHITLQVFNLATKGSLTSDLDLAFEDAARNHFILKGKGRPGADPALDLSLAAPELSLKGVAASLKLKKPGIFEEGKGSLQLAASLHRGELSATGTFRFRQLRYSSAGRSLPLAGSLEFAADYSPQRDAARLKSCQLRINDLIQVQATGTAQELKMKRSFSLDLGFKDFDLAMINSLMSSASLRDWNFGGRLGGETLHLAGKGGELNGVSGVLRLREGVLVKGGRLLVASLSGSAGFSGTGQGVLAKGRLQAPDAHGSALLTGLDLPFDLSFSRRMKPVKASTPAFSSRVMGVPLSGRVAFDAARPAPLTASLRVPAVEVAALRPLLQRYQMTGNSGIASVSLELAGKSLQQVAATVDLTLSDFQGARGGNALAVKKASVSARVRRGGGHLEAEGAAGLTGAAWNGKGGDASFRFKVADQLVSLEGAQLSTAGALISLGRLTGTLPPQESGRKDSGVPVSLAFSDASVRLRELQVSGLDGRLKGDLQTDPAGRWFEGSGDFAAGQISWQGTSVAAPTLQVAFSRSGAKGMLQGKLMGGALSGSLTGNPFAAPAGADFDLMVKDAEVAAAAPFIPKKAKARPSGGKVDLRLTGSYARPGGLSCRFESQGRQLDFTGAGGKTLVSGAALSLAGQWAGEKLTIAQALLSLGPGVGAMVKGALLHPFTAQRTGTLDFSLPATAANNLVDPLVNLVPRAVQEAALSGTVASDGKIELGEGKAQLSGGIDLRGGGFELPAQKLVVTGINGRIPYSLDLLGKTGDKPQGVMYFSRQNYPRLLEQLRRQNPGGELLSIDTITFGVTGLGALQAHLRAGNGLTEITSLSSSLYDGVLLGKGYLTMREGFNYRGDLLVNGLSLKQFCGMFPGIKGYISGRVDGVLSISGGPKGVAGISGFTELWAREGGGEKMLVSKEFLQRLAKQKLSGFFFRSDRSYDSAELKALMEQGDLTIEVLQIVHTNLFGVRDLSVSVAGAQNRIGLDHLLESIKLAASRGKPAVGGQAPAEAPPAPEFKWGE